jgi:taurine dioxygenase
MVYELIGRIAMEIIKCNENGIGVKVHGFDAKNPEGARQLLDLLYTNKIVILKDQSLDEKQLCDLSQALGEPIPYLQKNYHHPDFPLIFVSSNIKKEGQSMGVARTGGYWHSDTAFLEQPVPLTLLYPQVIPKNSRRTTLFIDLERAYAAMPTEMQQRLSSLRFIHSGKWKYKVRPEDAGLDISEILAMIHQVQPPVLHPAVISHPVTGQKILYATRGFTVGVEGLDTDSANALLEEVFAFVEQARFITEFQWQLGDIILWDNRFFAHKAGRLAQGSPSAEVGSPVEEDTLVYRIILNDGYPLGAQ